MTTDFDEIFHGDMNNVWAIFGSRFGSERSTLWWRFVVAAAKLLHLETGGCWDERPSWHVTSHPVELSLAIPSWVCAVYQLEFCTGFVAHSHPHPFPHTSPHPCPSPLYSAKVVYTAQNCNIRYYASTPIGRRH